MKFFLVPNNQPVISNIKAGAVRPNTAISSESLMIDLSQAEISPEQREQLQELFIEFRDRISQDSYDLGSYDASEIVIKTTTEVPPTLFRPAQGE